MVRCRTPALGGQLFRCDCGQFHFAYHSCNHRACPQCGHADVTEWLDRQRRRLLPVPYYLVTFTIPGQLRVLIRSNQKLLYDLLLRHSAGALLDVGCHHEHLRAQLGWVADVRAVGRGEPALKYLAAYVYRTAFSAERILHDDGRFITFSYRDGRSGQTRAVRLPPECFLHRFLQHVLPRGFQRVRSFGWLSAAGKTNWQRILALLDWTPPPLTPPALPMPPRCPSCRKPMKLLGSLPRSHPFCP